MAKKKAPEGHVNHERYLVTYSDLITLLLAFFIILYAMSDVNKAKFNSLAQSLEMAFNQGTPVLINTEMSQNVEIKKQTTQQEINTMKAVKEQNELRKLKRKIDEKVKEDGLQTTVKTDLTEEGLKVVLTNEILFNSGKANLKNNYIDIVDYISSIITDVQNPVQISGFTDNVPIHTQTFPSNWELSNARSVSVLKYFIEHNKKLNPTRFSSAGYGEYKPIASNTTPDGRKANRRVEVLIERINGDNLMKTTNEQK